MNAIKNPRLVVFSGAGLSADSGIATFRADTGLWANHDVRVVADGMTWRNHRNTIRNFYNDRRQDVAKAQPNAAHQQIAKWQSRYDTVILTQNIDNLLERAGCSDVIHLHGEITKLKCVACGNVWDIGHNIVLDTDRCPKCNSLKGTRPAVVFFNEAAPNYAKMYAAFKNLTAQDCVVVIGTSGQVINIDAFIQSVSSKSILNNLETRSGINESLYSHVIMGQASHVISNIDSLVTDHFNQIGAHDA